MATSGSYERGDHIWDVSSDRPAAGVASATVCGPDLALADALATGLVAAGSAGLDAVIGAGYQALLVLDDGKTVGTPEFLVPTAV